MFCFRVEVDGAVKRVLANKGSAKCNGSGVLERGKAVLVSGKQAVHELVDLLNPVGQRPGAFSAARPDLREKETC